MNIILHPEADAEFLAALQHYTAISPQLGFRFFDEITKALQEISDHPWRYRQFDPPARRLLAHGFPYAVVYVEKPDHVWALAIMHLKREPGYWRDRLRG